MRIRYEFMRKFMDSDEDAKIARVEIWLVENVRVITQASSHSVARLSPAPFFQSKEPLERMIIKPVSSNCLNDAVTFLVPIWSASLACR